MTRNAVLAACIALLLIGTGSGQEAKRVQEPEYIGVFYFVESATGALTPLERQTPEVKIKVKALGFGGGEGSIEVKGGKSPTRFKAAQPLSFVVRLASQQVDPLGVIQFFSLESKKDKRRLVISKAGSMGMSGKSVAGASAVSFNVSRYGESSFKISPVRDLPPGEYALSGEGIKDGFCFGVDPAEGGK
ncbi:MAG TPA: hypothetical protein VF508_02065 [Pyrinomonadaceae bacterium]|jgi:hypothetical protein